MSVQSCASWRRVMHSAKGKPAVRAQEQRQQKSSSLQPYPLLWHSMGKGTLNTSSAARIARGERRFNQCRPCCCCKKTSCKWGERGPHPILTPSLPAASVSPSAEQEGPTQIPSSKPLTQNQQHLEPQWFVNSPTPEEHSDRYFMHWKNKRDHKTA